MERSFKKEVQALKLGNGETFRGEGILAVTKALLQSGVSYVGGYQGAPVSHLLDVLVDAEDIMSDLGVHLETCSNEASAAASLGRRGVDPAYTCRKIAIVMTAMANSTATERPPTTMRRRSRYISAKAASRSGPSGSPCAR